VNVIFGRKKNQASPAEPDPADLTEDLGEDADDEDLEDDDLEDEESNDHDLDADYDEVDEEDDEWVAYDESQDWREDGPYDVEEVDLEADEVPRLDLGALIVTPEEGMQIQIIADAESGNGLALVLTLDGAAMQVEVKAAPQSSGFAAEIRGDIIEETLSVGGSAERVKGPYGTELRRVVPVESDGEEAFAPLRDWLVQGPRWLLVARLMGEAAIDVAGNGASVPFDEAFRNLIVRRGDEPMAPGQTVPLKVPEG
jgi:hypothetical protein